MGFREQKLRPSLCSWRSERHVFKVTIALQPTELLGAARFCVRFRAARMSEVIPAFASIVNKFASTGLHQHLQCLYGSPPTHWLSVEGYLSSTQPVNSEAWGQKSWAHGGDKWKATRKENPTSHVLPSIFSNAFSLSCTSSSTWSLTKSYLEKWKAHMSKQVKFALTNALL